MGLSSRNRGFTLVELLIVVAIIGVLSTVGVPTFRKMVQKSRRAEAKQALGSLHTAQNAFMTEYNSYGSNLSFMGFLNVEANPPPMFIGNQFSYYTVGYPKLDCSQANAIDELVPLASTAVGRDLGRRYPSYYDLVNAPTSARLPGDGNCGALDSFSDDGMSYTAVAIGALATGVTRNSAISEKDVWSIDEKRNLVHVQDGIK